MEKFTCVLLMQVQESNGLFSSKSLQCCNSSKIETFDSNNGVFYVVIPFMILEGGDLQQISYEFERKAATSVCDGKAFSIN